MALLLWSLKSHAYSELINSDVIQYLTTNINQSNLDVYQKRNFPNQLVQQVSYVWALFSYLLINSSSVDQNSWIRISIFFNLAHFIIVLSLEYHTHNL